MALDIVSFLFGGMLLLVGILGGGFEVREIKIPRVSVVPRVLAALVGLVFVLMGVGIQELKSEEEQPAGKQALQQAGLGPDASGVDFIIHDELGQSQVSEQVTVLIDGKRVGTLTINEHYPESMITVTVPQPGRYSYTVASSAVFNIGGGLHEIIGTGQGIISVTQGKEFELQGTISGNTWLVSLVERK